MVAKSASNNLHKAGSNNLTDDIEKYLDVIDGKIRELETEYKEIARAIMTAPADGAPDKEVNAGRHSRNEKY